MSLKLFSHQGSEAEFPPLLDFSTQVVLMRETHWIREGQHYIESHAHHPYILQEKLSDRGTCTHTHFIGKGQFTAQRYEASVFLLVDVSHLTLTGFRSRKPD